MTYEETVYTDLQEHCSVNSMKLNSGNSMKTSIFFRCDRKSDFEERGGGVMLAVSKSLNPKVLKDLNYLDKTVFESIWIDCRTTNSSASKKNQLINISYNQHKNYYWLFLEEVSNSIYILAVHLTKQNRVMTNLWVEFRDSRSCPLSLISVESDND